MHNVHNGFSVADCVPRGLSVSPCNLHFALLCVCVCVYIRIDHFDVEIDEVRDCTNLYV